MKSFFWRNKMAPRSWAWALWVLLPALVDFFSSLAYADDWVTLLGAGNYRAFLDDALRTPNFNAAAVAGAVGIFAPALANQVRRLRGQVLTLRSTTPQSVENDPYRLTTYVDYEEWLNRSIVHEWQLHGNIDNLLQIYPGDTGRFITRFNGLVNRYGTPGNVPDNELGIFPGGNIVESGPAAMATLRRLLGLPPGAPVPAPINGASWPPGVLGGGYTENGGAIDPENVAIVRHWNPPGSQNAPLPPPAPYSSKVPSATASNAVKTAFVNNLRTRLGINARVLPDGSIQVPANLPDSVSSIAWSTSPGPNNTRILSPDSQILAAGWTPAASGP